MALYVPDKTWQIDSNNTEVSASDSTFYRTALLNIKNALKAFGSNPWTVDYSSDDVTAGTKGDGVDRWPTITEIRGTSGSVGAWFVWNLPSGMQVLWHCRDDVSGTPTQVRNMDWWVSINAGFTGGSISVLPTATDGVLLKNGSGAGDSWFGNITGTVPNRVWHLWHSTDGLITRFVGFAAGVPFASWSFEVIKNPGAAHTFPRMWRFPSAATPTTNAMVRNNLNYGSRQGSLNFNLLPTFPGRDTAVANSILGESFMQVADELEGGVGGYEMSLCTSTIGARGGKRGLVFDLWAGQTPPPVTGDHFPLTPSPTREFVQIGHFVFKWDGTVIQTT